MSAPRSLAPKQTVLKKRPTLKDLSLKKAKRLQNEGSHAKKQKPKFKRAERICNEAISVSNEAVRLQRAMSSIPRGQSPTMHTLCFVFRVQNSIGATPQTTKILNLLRLSKPYSGVFLEFNSATVQMLRLVKPFVCYGTPTLKNIKDLIYKRAYCRPEGGKVRVPIVDNTLIEEHLGDSCGLICVEDLIHVIHKCDAQKDETFKRAIRFLAPFDLSAPAEGQSALLVKREDTLSGYQPDKIAELITSMI